MYYFILNSLFYILKMQSTQWNLEPIEVYAIITLSRNHQNKQEQSDVFRSIPSIARFQRYMYIVYLCGF